MVCVVQPGLERLLVAQKAMGSNPIAYPIKKTLLWKTKHR